MSDWLRVSDRTMAYIRKLCDERVQQDNDRENSRVFRCKICKTYNIILTKDTDGYYLHKSDRLSAGTDHTPMNMSRRIKAWMADDLRHEYDHPFETSVLLGGESE